MADTGAELVASSSDAAEVVHHRVCPLCEAMCGIKVSVRDNRVLRVRPDADNAWSRGHMCPKGTTLGALHHDPDRLRQPMIREPDGWREASWEEAFARIAALVANARAKRPDGHSASYFGNMMGKGYAASRYVVQFLSEAKLDQFYSSSTVDTMPRLLVNHLLYGNAAKMPIPDVDHTDLLLIMGGNPAVSQGNFFCHPNIMGAVRELQARGGRFIVVDPLHTATAQKADQWIPIRPGSDAAMLLALIHVVFEQGAVRLGAFEGLVNGLEAVQALAARFSPERVADFCGVPAPTLRTLAAELIAAPRASIYSRLGLCNQAFGTLSTWLMDVLIAVTGNLDKIGGTLWSSEVARHSDLFPAYPAAAPVVGRRTRVRGAPEVLGQFPAACLAEEIDTPGPGQISIFATFGANPALSAPNSQRLAQALSTLECMVSFDCYLNETTRHAHVILPALSLLEQPHWDVFGWPYALRSGGHYSPPTFAPEPGRPQDWEVMLRLGAIFGADSSAGSSADIGALDDAYFAAMCAQRGLEPAIGLAACPQRGPERIVELAIRTGPFGDGFGTRTDFSERASFSERKAVTLQDFKDAPAGLMLGTAMPQGAAALTTPSGKLELAPAYILADIARLDAAMAQTRPDLVLVNRRHLASLNSWMHNVEILMKGKARCTLLIHPHDAQRLGIEDGAAVIVQSAAGELSVPAKISSDVSPGVVSLPHGWGHDAEDTRMAVAKRQPGINTNILTPGTMDTPSSNAVLNGIPVRVRRAAPVSD